MKAIKHILERLRFRIALVIRRNGEISTKEILIKEMLYRDSTISLRLEHPLFYKVTAEMVSLFKGKGGVNYLSMDMFDRDIGEFEVIIQRKEGKTPAQVNMELKAKIAELEEKLSRSCV